MRGLPFPASDSSGSALVRLDSSWGVTVSATTSNDSSLDESSLFSSLDDMKFPTSQAVKSLTSLDILKFVVELTTNSMGVEG